MVAGVAQHAVTDQALLPRDSDGHVGAKSATDLGVIQPRLACHQNIRRSPERTAVTRALISATGGQSPSSWGTPQKPHSGEAISSSVDNSAQDFSLISSSLFFWLTPEGGVRDTGGGVG